ncbi:hypothetical protein EG327_004990 [Venturia inaequalis]|uniref:Uncharacterized protein n=1 Tax=Venturia inaequalis TaxID=5025 RepID=A0A8H3VB97_VENIN|nr:hypothetical protein EG327_004990 [Venturia inaequalis]
MYFRTFLPAIIFAQSSFAYWCCWKFTTDGHIEEATYIENGPKYRYNAGAGCIIFIERSGRNCAEWYGQELGNTCVNAGPNRQFGVTDASWCIQHGAKAVAKAGAKAGTK